MGIRKQTGFLISGIGGGGAMAFMLAFAMGFGAWFWAIPCGVAMVLLYVLAAKMLEV